MKTTNSQHGFTLIETMIAMAIFTIGILGLFGMQSAAIKENLAANSITSGSIWAADWVEQLIALDYDDDDLKLTNSFTCADFDEPDWWKEPNIKTREYADSQHQFFR